MCYRFRHMTSPRKTSDHFDGKEFHNLYGVPAGGSLKDVLRWKFLGVGGPVAEWPKHAEGNTVQPALPDHLDDGTVAVTFVGHSTFLFQFGGGMNVLVDPVWSERVSPVTFAGPKRVRPPAIPFDMLPTIHTVLVSHGHYDHMDLATLRRLDERFSPRFIAGLGNREFLQTRGLKQVEELDWWQSCNLDADWTVTFTPAQHWTSRTPTTRNRTLWGGFWMQRTGGQKPSLYFAGDSGFNQHFALIRERLGAPDAAFLPIGAYEPRWFMREQHMNPEDAVQAHLALGARQSVGMHFGTFQLTDEGIDEPAAKLAASLQAHGIDAARFRVPKFGETLFF